MGKNRNSIRKIVGYLWEPKGCFPLGYEYEKERNGAVLLLGAGVVLSFRFFRELYNVVQALYEYVDGRNVLKKNVVAASFGSLVAGDWRLYVPFLLFLAAMTICHYFYYYQETKSIYLMRRLPGRGVVFGSCVKGPLLGWILGMAALAVLYLLYYGIYVLVIPKECLP